MRVRGLKRKSLKTGEVLSESHPVRVRGLKLGKVPSDLGQIIVAPRAGAWIETPVNKVQFGEFIVAPRAGAWIETMLID